MQEREVNVVVLEDDQLLQLLYRRLIEGISGYQLLHVFGSLGEIEPYLQKLESDEDASGPPDIFLTDWRLEGGKTSETAIRRIRESGLAIAIIGLFGDEEIGPQLMEKGLLDAFLVKPVEQAELFATFEQVLHPPTPPTAV